MSRKIIYSSVIIFISFIIFYVSTSLAKAMIPALPSSNVYDPSNYLTSFSEDRLQEHNDTSDTQIRVYIADGLYGEDIDELAKEVSKVWMQSRKKDEKAITIVLSIDEHHAKLVESPALEGTLSELGKDHIIDNLQKKMRQKAYDKMIIEAIYDINKEVTNPSRVFKLGNSSFRLRLEGTLALFVLYGTFVVLLVLVVKQFVGANVKSLHMGQFEFDIMTNRWSSKRVPTVPDDWSFDAHLQTDSEGEV